MSGRTGSRREGKESQCLATWIGPSENGANQSLQQTGAALTTSRGSRVTQRPRLLSLGRSAKTPLTPLPIFSQCPGLALPLCGTRRSGRGEGSASILSRCGGTGSSPYLFVRNSFSAVASFVPTPDTFDISSTLASRNRRIEPKCCSNNFLRFSPMPSVSSLDRWKSHS